MATSHFFAYLSRMKFIRRWGLMHSTYPENIQEHSLRVAPTHWRSSATGSTAVR